MTFLGAKIHTLEILDASVLLHVLWAKSSLFHFANKGLEVIKLGAIMYVLLAIFGSQLEVLYLGINKWFTQAYNIPEILEIETRSYT